MKEQKKAIPGPQTESDALSSGDVPEQVGKEANIPYSSTPHATPKDKKIHPRTKLPSLPKGEDVPDDQPSPPLELD